MLKYLTLYFYNKVTKMKTEDLKPLRGLIPGWAIYNKWIKGVDYTNIGEHKYYPEIYESLRVIGAVIPVLGLPLGTAIFGSCMLYIIYSSAYDSGVWNELRLLNEEKLLHELQSLKKRLMLLRTY
jgi:hypothetical protein